VIATSGQAVETARQLIGMADEDRVRIIGKGRAADSMLRIHRIMMARPVNTPGRLAKDTGLSPATVNNSLRNLEELGILRELTGRRRNRVFSYSGYLEIMNKGTYPPSP
jgi:Fic family protein